MSKQILQMAIAIAISAPATAVALYAFIRIPQRIGEKRRESESTLAESVALKVKNNDLDA